MWPVHSTVAIIIIIIIIINIIKMENFRWSI